MPSAPLEAKTGPLRRSSCSSTRSVLRIAAGTR
jgi:hypothetical protein